MTFGSLFAGIGGIDLGLERAGMTCRWQVEIDPYACRVLAKHWPDIPRFGDIRTLTGEELEHVDLICGGFPCQDVSNAGKRMGIDGERSGLWVEYARLVRVLRPRYVLVENVSALLGRGLGRVLGDLAACGYDAEWDCIPAAAVGAPHRRDRIFIVAHAGHDGRERGVEPLLRAATRLKASHGNDPDGRGADVADAHGTGLRHLREGEARRERGAGRHAASGGGSGAGNVSDPAGAGLALWQDQAGLRKFATSVGAGQWAVEPDVGRVADGVPARVDRLRALGNAVVPQVAEFIGRRILALDAEAP